METIEFMLVFLIHQALILCTMSEIDDLVVINLWKMQHKMEIS